MRTVLSVSLPGKIAEELNAFASETGRNKSDVVKESLNLFLWEAKLHKAQKMLFSRAKAQGIVTEEDVFREIS
ncbi:MAG: CopG family transcriptional regulator [Proteobacteria bacterium]|nr:CopG family transcriptional regulator [Pseudomonadota bacterium]MBU1964195.1 CopG family transcriptional regulator [Pseudomonadota bacterium]